MNLLEEARKVNTSLSRVQTGLTWSVHQSQNTAEILSGDQAVIDETLRNHKINLSTALRNTKKRLDHIHLLEKIEVTGLKFARLFFTLVAVYIVLDRLRIVSLLWNIARCNLWSTSDEL